MAATRTLTAGGFGYTILGLPNPPVTEFDMVLSTINALNANAICAGVEAVGDVENSFFGQPPPTSFSANDFVLTGTSNGLPYYLSASTGMYLFNDASNSTWTISSTLGSQGDSYYLADGDMIGHYTGNGFPAWVGTVVNRWWGGAVAKADTARVSTYANSITDGYVSGSYGVVDYDTAPSVKVTNGSLTGPPIPTGDLNFFGFPYMTWWTIDPSGNFSGNARTADCAAQLADPNDDTAEGNWHYWRISNLNGTLTGPGMAFNWTIDPGGNFSGTAASAVTAMNLYPAITVTGDINMDFVPTGFLGSIPYWRSTDGSLYLFGSMNGNTPTYYISPTLGDSRYDQWADAFGTEYAGGNGPTGDYAMPWWAQQHLTATATYKWYIDPLTGNIVGTMPGNAATSDIAAMAVSLADPIDTSSAVSVSDGTTYGPDGGWTIDQYGNFSGWCQSANYANEAGYASGASSASNLIDQGTGTNYYIYDGMLSGVAVQAAAGLVDQGYNNYVQLYDSVLNVNATGLLDEGYNEFVTVFDGTMNANAVTANVAAYATNVGMIQSNGALSVPDFTPNQSYNGQISYYSTTTGYWLYYGYDNQWHHSGSLGDDYNSFACSTLIGTYTGIGPYSGESITTNAFWNGTCAHALSGGGGGGSSNLTGPITSSGSATSIASQTGSGTTFAMSEGPTLDNPTLTATGTTVSTDANNSLRIVYTGADGQSGQHVPLLIDASGSSIDSCPAFLLILRQTGQHKGFQIRNGTDTLAWASFEYGTYPGLFLGPGGSTTRDANLYRYTTATLQTDGSFNIGVALTVTGAASLGSLTVGGKTLTVSNNATISGTHSGTSSGTNTGDQNNTGVVGIGIDGGGAPITTGIKGYIVVPYAGTLNNYSLIADQAGSISIDVWKIAAGTTLPAVGQTICGSNYPALSSAAAATGVALTSWSTVAVTANDMFGFNVRSASAVTKVTLSLKITKS